MNFRKKEVVREGHEASTRVVNGQRIKYYISGNPINVETNIIETVTPKEYIRDTFQNVQTPKRNRYVVR